MPSPVGHALGGAIVGLAAATSSDTKRLALTCTIVACLPDLDFLWGRHGMETHSLGAAVMAGLVALAITRGRQPRPAFALGLRPAFARGLRRGTLAIAVAVAWASHVLFDWLGSDTTPPLGVMALWPWSSEYYFSNAFFFDAISRRYWLDGFWRHNIFAVIGEVLWLGPPLVVLRWWRLRLAGRG